MRTVKPVGRIQNGVVGRGLPSVICRRGEMIRRSSPSRKKGGQSVGFESIT